ncbi:hypothetical protein SteCoe_23560 [Stentor coeruleus]|uniref:Uncharacterized protein n=1 Tax=Stentor coeruleus TaxID=5963 RepID=A0A1R2BJK7_9CILI|nr:hypothetical protein SteCoe_23560 [Stentor coeruleus]
MQKSVRKSSQSALISVVTTRGTSANALSPEKNAEVTFSSAKDSQVRRNSCPTIEESLIQKYSESQKQMARLRQVEKFKQLQDLRQAPSQYPGSKKMFKPRSQEEIRTIAESIPHKKRIKGYVAERKNDTRRPQDVIPMPDVEAIRQALEKVTPRDEKVVVDVYSMSITDKTEAMRKKKSDKVELEKQKLIEKEMEQCTFKPDTKMSKKKLGSHRKTLSMAEIHSQKKPLSARTDRKGSAQGERKEIVRPPAPNKGNPKQVPITPDIGLFISPSYAQLSPAKLKCSYGEEAAIDSLKKRSKKMMTYNYSKK